MSTATKARASKVQVNMGAKLRKKYSSDDFKIPQRETIHIAPLGQALDQSSEIVVVSEKAMHKKYLEALAFANEAIMIELEPPMEDNPPHCHPCWVQGKGAEIFHDGRWIAYGAFPYGVKIITRRKYAEVLLRSKRTRIASGYTKFERTEDNWIKPSTTATVMMRIHEDRSPLAKEWLERSIHFS